METPGSICRRHPVPNDCMGIVDLLHVNLRQVLPSVSPTTNPLTRASPSSIMRRLHTGLTATPLPFLHRQSWITV